MSHDPEETGLTRRNAPVSLAPRTMDEALVFAEKLAGSTLVPKDMKDKPANVFLAIQLGAELGLPPMQAIQSIAVINGRPTTYGDGLMAIVRASGLLEDFEETFDDSTMTATCRVKRKGASRPRIETFSWADADKVVQTVWEDGQRVRRKLTEKDTYKNYPKRMLRMRARTFALRDEFADVLRGMTSREELDDSDEFEINVTPASSSSLATRPAASDLMPKPKTETAATAPTTTPAPTEAPRPMTAEEFVDGLSPSTPAEKEPPAAGEQQALPVDPPKPAQASPALITEDARRRLFAEMKKVNKTVGDLKVYLQQTHSIDSTKAIPVDKYDAVLKWCQMKPAREPGQEG